MRLCASACPAGPETLKMHLLIRGQWNSALTLAALFGIVTPLAAQTSFGIQAGVPLNDFILDRASGSRFSFSRVNSAPRRYTLGPSLEMPLAVPFGIEATALYKRFGFDTAAGSGGLAGPFVSVVSSTTGNAWEFPIAVKARLRLPRGIVWFAGAGRPSGGSPASRSAARGWCKRSFLRPPALRPAAMKQTRRRA
jgi:hypothetical protein